jgi:O-antigen/teichoic acid export membrane protein
VIGTVAGAAVGAAVALRASPYPLRLRFDGRRARSYVSFSWPIAVAGAATIVTAQGLTAVAKTTLGLGAVGVIALSAQISQFADRADRAVSDTLYPAICSVADRADLLREAFVKSNRLTLMWSLPFGFGVALFADDLIRVFGREWSSGVDLIRATAVALAVHQIGFNWTAFYRAKGTTRPIAVAAAVAVAVMAIIVLPLLAWRGLDGLALGVLAAEVVHFAVRARYVERLFPGLGLVRHGIRAIGPVLPAVGIVLLLRAAEHGDRTQAEIAAELLAFGLAAIAAALWAERPLLREAWRSLRG